MPGGTNHITVCVCTYQRPFLLKRLLDKLAIQQTNGLFSYSIVIVDNDRFMSARMVVEQHAASSSVPVKYCVEEKQSIALARNTAVRNSCGDYIAFLDDDEFPIQRWLLTLFEVCNSYGVDGVLGPVKRYFDEVPPQWIVKGKFYERPTRPTGLAVKWAEARTGNVLLRTEVFDADAQPFRPQFRTGEDVDFFRRMIMEKRRIFIWCSDAVVYEVVPPMRWKRTFMLRRALLRGAINRIQPTFGVRSVAKSIIAVPLYFAALPVAFLLGHHRVMAVLVRLCDHLGKLLALAGINPIREPYVTE